jgi:hypothetical protein
LKLDTISKTIQDKITTIVNLSVSDPQVTSLLHGATLDHIRNLKVISNVVTDKLAPISQDILALKNSPTSTIIHPKLGFSQTESKDFSVSKFTKELDHVTLQGNTLKELELFWDSIQRALTYVCRVNQVFPNYRVLAPTFTFRLHILGDPRQLKYSSIKFNQAKQNYQSFGDSLCLHLHTTSTIDES